MKATDPATGKLIREYPEHGEDEVAARLQRADSAFRSWSLRPVTERSALLHSLAGVLRADFASHAALMTSEMGKPIAQAEAEVEKCATTCDWFADQAAALLAPEPAATEAAASAVRFDPLGVVLAVMPWNFPFWQVIRCAAPALVAGNTVLLKHASNVPGCALALEGVFRKAGFPEGAFTTLLIPARTVGEVIAHPAVRAVSLTGSEAAGRQVAALAGASLK
jgi:succinate-semialdehyde dehydrogenase/glutarate-semialdehyde dehydrogenase